MKALNLLLTAILILAAGSIFANKQITFHGQIETLDGGYRKGMVMIDRADGSTDSLAISANGKFNITVEENTRVLLTFKQNGYITKVVEVNTVNCFPKFKADTDRSVRFDVQLLPQSPNNDLAFAAPVGHITFTKGSGLMKVNYDHTLVTLAQENVTASR
ncbi:MAG: hypothetical protein IPK99_10600 [Flavobacteriales bacterium]|nr:hypothetical protein [Flavobacteriales bacterium]